MDRCLTANFPIQCHVLRISMCRDGHSSCLDMVHTWNSCELGWMKHWVTCVPVRWTCRTLFLLTKEASESVTEAAQIDIFDDNNVQETIIETSTGDSKLPRTTNDR